MSDDTITPAGAVVLAADHYAREPTPATREAFKAALRALIDHLTIQRDFDVEVAAEGLRP